MKSIRRPSRFRVVSRHVPATFLFAAAFLLLGCEKAKEAGEEEKKNQPAARVQGGGMVVLGADAPELHQMKIDAVQALDLPTDEVSAPAKIEANPNRVGHAVLPAAGRITRVMVKLGDAVTKGQELVAMDSPTVSEAESAYVQSESAVQQAELAHAKASADLARLADLYEHQAVAQKDLLAAKTASALTASSVEQSRTSRDQAKRRLELLGLKAGGMHQQLVVHAPVSGKVLEVSVVEGEFRNEINTALVTIADLSRVWATSEVPESEIRLCKVGGPAELELIAYPGEVFRAKVTRIADTVNSETRTIKVNAELDNRGGRLRPEMFGRVRSATGVAPVPWIPGEAVVRLGSKDLVFVEQQRGHFQSRPVELGQAHEHGFAVKEGLKAGERVVTRGAVYLKAAL